MKREMAIGIDKTAKAIYQTNDGAIKMLDVLLKEIALFTQYMTENNILSDEKTGEWVMKNNMLMDAIEDKDYVLIADILHFEIAPFITDIGE
jgi:hypothetical protein